MSHDRHDSKEDGGVRRLHGLRVAVGMSVGSAASALSARRAVIAGIVVTTEAGVGAPEKVRHLLIGRRGPVEGSSGGPLKAFHDPSLLVPDRHSGQRCAEPR